MLDRSAEALRHPNSSFPTC